MTTSTWQQTKERATALRQDSHTADSTEVQASVRRFISWLDGYGETSYDHQSFFREPARTKRQSAVLQAPDARDCGRIANDSVRGVLPFARALFYIKQRFPIADAHYAMGFAFLAETTGDERHYRRAVHFLDVLESTRCPGYEHYCWGYPFDWETRTGTMKHGTPLITRFRTSTRRFVRCSQSMLTPKWQRILQSIADTQLTITTTGKRLTARRAARIPLIRAIRGVINASAYRAFVLTRASLDLSNSDYRRIAERNMRFVLEAQNEDGSWYYSMMGRGISSITSTRASSSRHLQRSKPSPETREPTKTIERGGAITYSRTSSMRMDSREPFSRRLTSVTVYRNELYDYAECINLAVLLQGRFAPWTTFEQIAGSRPLAEARRLVPGQAASARVGQRSDASLGTSTNVQGSSVSSCAKRSSEHSRDVG